MNVRVLHNKKRLRNAFNTQKTLKKFKWVLARRGLTGKVIEIDRTDNTCKVRFDGQIGSEASHSWMPIEALQMRQVSQATKKCSRRMS